MRDCPKFSNQIFAATEPDSRMTIVTASSPEEARRHIRNCNWFRLLDWDETELLRFSKLTAVSRLEFGVGSRRELNAPTFCHVRTPGREFAWKARGTETTPEKSNSTNQPEESSSAGPRRIWSYVPEAGGLVFFDAPDREVAGTRALARVRDWGFAPPDESVFVFNNIEPIERLVIRLGRLALDGEPEYYRAWIEGIEVGWPPQARISRKSSNSVPRPPTTSGNPAPAYALPPGRRYRGWRS